MYNKLFTKILDSSIWLEADTTRLVWITFLASMDEDGFCAFSSIENLSRRANITLEDTKKAVIVLESEDKFSNQDEFQGRRIERVENGWIVLKAPYYRSILTREIQREKTRLRVQKHRSKDKNVTNGTLPNVTNVTDTNVTHAEASTAAAQIKSEQKKKTLPSFLDVREFFGDDSSAQDFWDHYTSNGWKVGRVPMKDWEAAARGWQRRNLKSDSKPKMSPQHRQNRINYLNEKKAETNRLIQDPYNPPSWAVKQLEEIDAELQTL